MVETKVRDDDQSLLQTDTVRHLKSMRELGALDYRSNELPIWCPGCGYFGITHAVNQALNQLGIENHNLTVVSGIGCAGRYPYFTNCYGFHVVHGRTLPVACGVKMVNEALTVLAVGGDGDGLAIGGGHLPHAVRRNVDLTYLFLDNGIYGLTKGQTSPTTPQGQVTGTHPYGNPEPPLNPALMALSQGASFVAKGYAGEPKILTEIIAQAFQHRGFSFVHIVSPCVTFDHSNLLYNRLRSLWSPLPEEHNRQDRQAAFALALSDKLYAGVYYQDQRPAWHEQSRATTARATAK